MYDVVDHVWEDWDHKVDFSNIGQAAVVQNNTLLCWCSKYIGVVPAYDLVLGMWFISFVNGLDWSGMLEPDEPRMHCPLFRLDDNHLCFLWEDLRGYDGTEFPLVHCNKIRVLICRGAQGEFRFDTVVVASRSYVLLGQKEMILNALVL